MTPRLPIIGQVVAMQLRRLFGNSPAVADDRERNVISAIMPTLLTNEVYDMFLA